VDFVAGNLNKLQKLIFWKEKKKFNVENVKSKECVHTWANDTGDTSGYKRKGRKFGCIIQMAG